jgi:hypothetical protein
LPNTTKTEDIIKVNVVVTDTIRNGVDTEKLFATLFLINAQPELAKFQFRATNRWIEGATARRSTAYRRRRRGHLQRRVRDRRRRAGDLARQRQRRKPGRIPAARARRLRLPLPSLTPADPDQPAHPGAATIPKQPLAARGLTEAPVEIGDTGAAARLCRAGDVSAVEPG